MWSLVLNIKASATNKIINQFLNSMSKKKPGHSSYNAVNTRSHKQSEETKTDEFNKLFHNAPPSRGQKNSRIGNNNSNYNNNSNKGASAQFNNSSNYRDDRRETINTNDYRAERIDN